MVQQRDKAKAKRPAATPSSGARAASAKPVAGRRAGQSDEVAALSARIAELERQLAEQQRRTADLEALRVQALNRIEWAIDSLHNVIEGED
jgi:Tfp pilus assembly protein FimV